MNPQRFARLRAALARRQPDLTVLMERVSKTHNFSAIVRSCDAVGVLEAHVVPPTGPFRLHHGSSAGTKKWIRVRHHDDAPSAITSLKGSGFRVVAADPGAGSIDFRDYDFTAPTALLMGAERYGVSEDSLSMVDASIHIPMEGMVRSLNVSVAAALILFEAARQRRAAGLYERSRLAPAQLERRLFEWAYPELAQELRTSGSPYPELDEGGEIVRDPSPPDP
jgi:tRNA (guanosine-2'-O-)-methyltransferase